MKIYHDQVYQGIKVACEPLTKKGNIFQALKNLSKVNDVTGKNSKDFSKVFKDHYLFG